MADFGVFSDTDDSAVEELISQMQDLSVLDQVSAINCSVFADSHLPADLDSRFRRLKSFPLNQPIFSHSSIKPPRLSKTHSHITERLPDEEDAIFSSSKPNPDVKKTGEKSIKGKLSSDEEAGIFSDGARNTGELKDLKEIARRGSASSPSVSSDCSPEKDLFSPSKQCVEKKRKSASKSKSGSFASSLGSFNSWLESPSPPRRSGCFWCSPKRVSKRQSKKHKGLSSGLDRARDGELLSDLSTFSAKEQQKLMKKAIKEQEKISREAEKIVNWAKQASARMSFQGIEDETSEDEISK